MKRQRRVPLPSGVDYWDFDCRFGTAEANAVVVHFATITGLIDAVAKGDGDREGDAEGKVRGEQFYLELLAKPGHRNPKVEGLPIWPSPAPT